MKTLLLAISLLSLNAHAIDGLPSERYDDYDVAKYQSIHDEAARRTEAARARLEEADRNLEAARSAETQLRSHLDALQRHIQELQRDEQGTYHAIQVARTDQQNQYADLQRRAAEIQELTRQHNQAQQNLGQARQRQAEAQKDVNQEARQLEVLARALETTKNDHDQKEAAAENNRKAIEAAQNEAQAAQNARKSAADAIEVLKNQKLPAAQEEKRAANQDIPGKREAKVAIEQRAEALRMEIENIKKEIEVARAAGDKEKVERLRAQLNEKQAQARAVEQALLNATRELQQAEQRLARAEAAIEQIRKEIEQKTAALPALEEQARAARQRAEQLRANQPALNAALERAKANLQEARSVFQAQKQRVDQAQARLNEIVARVQEINQRVENLERRIQNERREYAQAETRYREIDARARELERHLEVVRQAIAQRSQERDNTARNLAQAESNSRSYEVARAQALNEFQAQDQDRAQKRVRLDEVAGNVEMARQRMNEIAGSHGYQDGEREGREFALAEGRRDGAARGEEHGRARGIADGKKRDYDSGFAAGRARGTEKGRADATAKAENDGQRSGTEKGRADGLVVAYNTGKAEGLRHGAETGSDKAAYARGREKGEAEGHARAREEAQMEERVGYHDKEQEFLNAPLKQVTLGDDTLATGFLGLQAAGAEHGDGRYYNPRPNRYPHPVIEQFYRASYDEAYRSNLDATYASVYKETYESNYDEAYEAARARELAKDYPQERERGDKEAYARFYKETFDRVYAEEYRLRYQRHYDAAFAVAKVDPAAKKRGFDEGNAIASEEKGLIDGRVAGYENNLENEKRIAYNRGAAQANKRYSENAIIEVVSSSLVDANRDGIFMPGEAALVELVVKNFGLQAKKDLRALVQVSGRGVSAPNPNVAITAVPAQSLATIRAVARAEIGTNALEGTQFGIRFSAADENVRHQNSFNAQVSFPSVVLARGFNGAIIPGAVTKLELAVTNKSQKTQNLVLSVDVDAAKADVVQKEIALAPLAAGQTAQVTVELIGKEEAHFEAAPVTIRALQSRADYAKVLTVNAAILRKHQKDPNAKGLLLAADLSRGGARGLFAAQKLDTWDLRIDGPIQSAELLDAYLGRTVHLVSDGSALDRLAIQRLQDFVKKGGALVIWGAEMGELAPQLSAISGVLRADRVAATGKVVGRGMLEGMALERVDAGGLLTIGGGKTVAVLVERSGLAVGTSNHVNEFTDNVGRVLVIALSPESLGKEEILEIQNRFDRMKLSFAKKMEMAAGNAADLSLVIEALKEEARDDDARSDVEWFDDKEDETRIAKAIDTFLEKEHPRRLDFAKLYPVMYKAAKEMRDEDDRDSLIDILETRRVGWFIFGSSWKDVYCSDVAEGYSEMCPSQNYNGNGNM